MIFLFIYIYWIPCSSAHEGWKLIYFYILLVVSKLQIEKEKSKLDNVYIYILVLRLDI